MFVVDAATGADAGRPGGGRAAPPGDGAGPRRRQQGRQREARARGRRVLRARLGRDVRRSRPSHGRGTGDLLDAIVWALPPETDAGARPQGSARPRRRPGPTRSRPGGSSRSSSAEPEEGDDGDGGRRPPSADEAAMRPRPRVGRRDRRRGRHGARRDRVRRPAERRQVEPAQRAARRGAGDRVARSRARRATPSTRGSRGAAARSSSSTRPASGGAARSPSGPAAERYSTLRALKALSRADVAVLVHRRRRGADRRRTPTSRATRSRRARASSSRSTSGTSSRTRPTRRSTSTSSGSATRSPFLDFAPIVSISAKTGQRVGRVLELAVDIWARAPPAHPDRRAQPAS